MKTSAQVIYEVFFFRRGDTERKRRWFWWRLVSQNTATFIEWKSEGGWGGGVLEYEEGMINFSIEGTYLVDIIDIIYKV